jgi:hypothetical protein
MEKQHFDGQAFCDIFAATSVCSHVYQDRVEIALASRFVFRILCPVQFPLNYLFWYNSCSCEDESTTGRKNQSEKSNFPFFKLI